MRILILALALAAASLLAACGGAGEQQAGSSQTNATPTPAPAAQRPAGASNSELGAVSSHGGGSTNANVAAGGSAAADRALVDTKELDARIKESAEKAKMPGAGAAERQGIADAYLERGNVYYSAGQPRLYRYALADFREALRYDPRSKEAKQKIEQIEDIYRKMGRPIPNVSADQ